MDETLEVVIPSKGRASMITKATLKLVPHAIVCVEPDDVPAYEKVTRNLWVHPKFPTLGAIRDWIVQNCPARVVVMLDDDAEDFWILAGPKPRKRNCPHYIIDVLHHVARCADEAGAELFGLARTPNPRHRSAYRPFELGQTVSALYGHIGKALRYDHNLSIGEDIDISLQAAMRNRIVWLDKRWSFTRGYGIRSGLADQRDQKAILDAVQYLRRKWGDLVRGPTVKRPTSINANWGRRFSRVRDVVIE